MILPAPPLAPAAPPLARPAATASQAAAARAAQDFEAQALGALLQPMFAGLPTGGFFGGGSAEAQWRPMLVDAIARDLARSGGLGLAAAVQREIIRMQAETTP
jgi:Rod binding domain-containing protein